MPEGPPASAPGSAPPLLRPRTGAAWAVIAVVFLLLQVLHFLPRGEGGAEDAALDGIRLQVQQMYGMRLLAEGMGAGAGAGIPEEALRAWSRGPVPLRQRRAVVLGDLRGPAAAREALEETGRLLRREGLEFRGREGEVQEALLRLYAGDGERPSPEVLPEERRELLRRELDWFGDLALAPEGSPGRAAVMEPARTLATRLLVVGLSILALLAAGCLAALLHWLAVSSGRVRFRFPPGVAPHGIYAETFALWMVLFTGLQAGLSLLLGPGSGILLPGLAGFLGSLAALRWPVRRGVPWARVRADLGLFLSPTPFRDALAGVACWVMSLPVMAAGLVVMMILLKVQERLQGPPGPFQSAPVPTHPLSGELGGGAPLLPIYLLACVAAPLVEETFFRGVLYRHLREATREAGRPLSVLLAAAASGLFFAAVHPQGWMVVPLLFAVAWGLVHAREWRGSLLAPVVAHGLHNAVATTVAVWALR